VYAGVDPVTKKRHNLIEVVEPGPRAWRQAEEIRERLLREVTEKRSPRTSATIEQLLERYLDQFAGSPNTLELYRTHVRNHILPLLGHVKVGQLDAENLLCRVHVRVRWNDTRCSRRIRRNLSRPTWTRRLSPWEPRWAASFRTLQCVNGAPITVGRAVAVVTMDAMSSSLIWRGRPPAH